jgi:hypothetical protein
MVTERDRREGAQRVAKVVLGETDYENLLTTTPMDSINTVGMYSSCSEWAISDDFELISSSFGFISL